MTGRLAVDACVFDAYGTLLDLGSATGRFRAALGDKADAFAAVWRAKQLEYTWLRSLMGRYADFARVTADALDAAVAATGTGAELRRDLLDQYRRLAPFPDARPALGALRRAGLRTAILSNGAPDMLAAAVDGAGLGGDLDAVLSADEAGVYKPHPAVYQLACDRFSLARERIAFVSANMWDAAGAAAFGLRVVWLDRTGAAWEPLPAAPDARVDGLDELPPLLGAA